MQIFVRLRIFVGAIYWAVMRKEYGGGGSLILYMTHIEKWKSVIFNQDGEWCDDR